MSDSIGEEAMPSRRGFLRRRWWVLALGAIGACAVGVGIWFALESRGTADEGQEAPEAAHILAVQSQMPFQVMIPGYLPEDFDREAVAVKVDQAGPAGEPMVELQYSTDDEEDPASVYFREWVPGNPDMETLAGSRPIQTKWGKGWLLRQEGLIAIWSDVGATRVSVFTPDTGLLTQEQVLGMAESLGPASNKQVFTFIVDEPVVAEMPPPPAFEVPINAAGVQEFTLVVTPGGYDPIRVAVKKGVPVRMTFRQLGQVGCGNELIFPADPANLSAIQLLTPDDEQVLEFTPQQVGQFQFYCGHQMYRGLLTVTE